MPHALDDQPVHRRREAVRRIAWLDAAVLLNRGALAAAAVAPREYLVLTARPAEQQRGRVEVLEFFSYTCPHCFRLEAFIGPWTRRKAQDVEFRRIPVVFQDSARSLARAYLALNAMGRIESLHVRMFEALHVQHVSLDRERTLYDWLGTQGVDARRFREFYHSFAVDAAYSRAQQLVDTFRIDSVPSIVVGRRYLTSTELAGGKEAVPHVLDRLVARVQSDMQEQMRRRN